MTNPHDAKAAAIFAAASRNGQVLDVHRKGATTLTVRPAATAAQQAIADAVVAKAKAEPTQEDLNKLRELEQDAAARMLNHRDAILRMLLTERAQRGELATPDPQEADAQGLLKGFQYEDGTFEYELNGKVLVTFWVPDVAFDFEGDGFMNVFQRYRVAL